LVEWKYPETITLRKMSSPRTVVYSLCGRRTKKFGEPWPKCNKKLSVWSFPL